MKKIKLSLRLSVMRAVGVGISLFGFLGIFLVKLIFDNSMKSYSVEHGYLPMDNDNFYLYFKLSLIICAVLLGLTVLSSFTYAVQNGGKGRFSRFIVVASPAVCSITMLILSWFYAYLTYGKNSILTPCLIILGVCEAALFFFSFALAKAVQGETKTKDKKTKHKKTAHKTKK